MFYQDLFNCLLAWARTRRWRRLIWLAFFPGLFFWLVVGLVVYGATISRQDLATRYYAMVRADVDAGMLEAEGKSDAVLEDDSNASESSPNVNEGQGARSSVTSQRVLVPLRRMLQLGNSNERVVYLVGAAMAQQGRVAMAVQLLSDLAPARGGGFPPAHAFMAEHTMASWQGTEAQAEVLMAHLQTAERGGMKLSQFQLVNYASLLAKFGRRTEAINMLNGHTAEYPQLNLMVIQLDEATGESGSDSRTALAAGRAVFENKQKSGKVMFEDVRLAVQLEVKDEQLDRAVQLAKYGYDLVVDESDQDKLIAGRLFSDVLLLKHRALSEQRELDLMRAERLGTPPPPLDLRYLELACQVDSANPAAGEELAKAMVLGQNLSAELQQALERSLLDGTASGVTHLILANRKLTQDQPHTALPELRLALRKMPNSPIVMNNLAFAILKYETENLKEANELIERALKIPGASQVDRASMLDTLAEIRLAQGDDLGAIEMFEEAIKHDPTKLNTRKKLAEVYSKAGMKELAQGQLRKINELSEK